jgi:hypothetical protein
MSEPSDFLRVFYGRFEGLLGWAQFDDFWQRLRRQADGWYLYTVGEAAPDTSASVGEFEKFISTIDDLFKRKHREDFCGIVYAGSRAKPTMVKIYHPNNLGVSCGFSRNPPLPGWVLCRQPPQPVEHRQPASTARYRWWNRLWV